MSTGTIEFYCEHPCDSCSRGGETVWDDFYVDVREVQANAGGSWTARGEGVSRCPRCGAMVR